MRRTLISVSAETAAKLDRITLEIYRRGAALAAERGVLIAGTKLEFGQAADESLMLADEVLADEVLTPDSSRFWPADSWVPGRPQHSLDKQFLRDWSAALDWDRIPPGSADVLSPRSPRRQEVATTSTRCLR